jgi:hypothetical protein
MRTCIALLPALFLCASLTGQSKTPKITTAASNAIETLMRDHVPRLSTESTSATNRYSFHFKMVRTNLTAKAAPITTALFLAADTNRTLIRMSTADGLPYCQIEREFLAAVDPQRPGGLCFREGGLAYFAFRQFDDTNRFGQELLYGIPTDDSPSKTSDINFNLGGAMWPITHRMVAADFDSKSRILRMDLDKGIVVTVVMTPEQPRSKFGVAELRISDPRGMLSVFNEFRLGPKAELGFPVLTRAKLESIGLPLREMAPDEVIDSSFLFNPPNSPDVMSRTKAARELEKLLKP